MRRLLPLLSLLLIFSASPVGADETASLVRDLADPARRVAAMNSLRTRMDPAAVPLLLESIPALDETGRYYLVLILDAYPPKVSRSAFRALLREDDVWLRFAAASSLMRRGEREMGKVVAKDLLAETVSSSIRTRMLARLPWTADPEVTEAVLSLLSPDQDSSVVGAVLWYLTTATPALAEPAVRALLTSERVGFRALAGAWLLRAGHADAAEPLAAAIATGETDPVELSRICSLLTGARAVPESVLAALTGLLEIDGSVGPQNQIIGLLTRHRYRAAVPRLRELVDHENRLVARAAFEALLELGGGLGTEDFLPMLEAPDPERRLWAADALRRIDDQSGLSVVIAVLDEGTTTERAEAARVLGGFRVPAAVEPLSTALLDPELSVRSYASKSLDAVFRSLFPYRRIDLATTGYDQARTPEQNRDAVKRVREFYEAYRKRDW